MLLTLSAASFSQQTEPTKPLTRADYLHKSKTQKTVAWILVGTGATMFAIAAPGNVSLGANAALVIGGAAAILASIPFFIGGAKNKRKASAMTASLRMENADVFRGYSMTHTYYPALSVKINLR